MVIGLNGRMGAGKNTVAERLAVYSPLPVVEVSFAAKLKQSVAALLGCTLDDIEQWKNDPDVWVQVFDSKRARIAGGSMRSFLQRYGTEAHRDVFGEDFWLDAALPIDGDYSDALYVVADMRFPNEAQRVRDVGGITVHVVGPDTADSTHRSEIPLACELAINNAVRDDDFAALDRNVRVLLDALALPIAA